MMNKTWQCIGIVAAGLLLANIGHSQAATAMGSPAVTHVTKATILAPGLSYERAIGQRSTLIAAAHAGTSLNIGGGAGSFDVDFELDPVFRAGYRYYYNYEQRSRSGKRTALNSLNYVSAVASAWLTRSAMDTDLHLREDSRRGVYTLGAVWGFQRNYPKRFSLDLNIGLGYYFTSATVATAGGGRAESRVSGFSIPGQLSLGIWLNKRK